MHSMVAFYLNVIFMVCDLIDVQLHVKYPRSMASESSPSPTRVSPSEEEGSHSTGQPKVIKKRKSYDSEFKVKVVDHAVKFSNREAGRKYDVDEKCIREWRKSKDKLQQLPKKCSRLPGGGRKPCAPEMEEVPNSWQVEVGWKNSCVVITFLYRGAMQ